MTNGNCLRMHSLASQRIFPHRNFGFSYVFLLIVIAVLGIFASGALQLGVQISRRDAEHALLAAGGEFERALYSYSGTSIANQNSNASIAKGPRTLNELLKDPRSAGILRHLRRVYADPLTGLDNWGIVRDPAGFILGVYSQAPGQPIKQAAFEISQSSFENAAAYSQWIFGLPSAQAIAKQQNVIRTE